MFLSRRSNHALGTRFTCPRLLTPRIAYSTEPEKVETPVQSQRKDRIAGHGYGPAESIDAVQTPAQSLGRASVASNRPLTILDPWPLYTLFGGLIAGSVFVYFYYHHRKEHMEKKWAAMLKEAEMRKNADR